MKKAALLLVSLTATLLLAEGLLRLLYPDTQQLYVWQPNLQHTFYPDSAIFPGIKGPSLFTINDYGVREDTFYTHYSNNLKAPLNDDEKGHTYYLFVGGSTTECLYLDDYETWWNDIGRHIGDASDIYSHIVGSIGKSGCTSRENYLHIKYFVPQFKRINCVVVMCGLNDFMKRLSQDSLYDNDFRFTPGVESKYLDEIFLNNSKNKTWWRRTALYQVLQNALHKARPVKWENVQDDTGQIYAKWRSNRLKASHLIDTLPDLTAALDEYARNLNLMIDEAAKQHIEIMFINQAAIWKDTMPAYEKLMLWMGGKGNFQLNAGAEYYSPKALRKGVTLYNNRLKDVCKERRVNYIDIDSVLPRNLSAFYDDCHLNEEGARIVSKEVYNQIKWYHYYLDQERLNGPHPK